MDGPDRARTRIYGNLVTLTAARAALMLDLDIAPYVVDLPVEGADVAGPNRVSGRMTRLAQVATTAGTGSEAGIRSLITDPEKGSKIAVESPHLIADLGVLDPGLFCAARSDCCDRC